MKLFLDTTDNPLPVLDIPADFYPELSRTNPFLTSEGSQSVPFTIPASRGNLRKLGFPERLCPEYRPETKRPAILSDGNAWIKGTLYIESVNMLEGITCTFYTNEGRLYEQLKGYQLTDIPYENIGKGLTVDQLMSMFETEVRKTTGKSNVYAICCAGTDMTFCTQKNTDPEKTNNEVDYKLLLNELLYNESGQAVLVGHKARKYYDGPGESANEISVPAGYGVTPFLRVKYVLECIFKHLGYIPDLDLFDTNVSLKNLVVLNNVADACVKDGGVNPSILLPEVTAEEFISAVRRKFGVEFIELTNGVITAKTWSEAIDRLADYEIFPDDNYTINYEDKRGISMEINNLGDGNKASYYTDKHTPPAGVEEESISFADQTPTTGSMTTAYIQDLVGGNGIPNMYAWGPNIGTPSHANTQLQITGEDTNNDPGERLGIAFCFVPDGIRDEEYLTHKYPVAEGTLRDYDFNFVRWGSFNLFVNEIEGMESIPIFDYSRNLYATFYTERDRMLQTANQQIVCNARIPSHEINSMDVSRPKIINGQKVLLERIDYVLGRPDLCQVTARTLHEMQE